VTNPDSERPYQPLGDTIRQLRNEKGVAQEKFALDAGLPRNYVSAVELGKRNTTYRNLRKLLAALGTNWQEFGAKLHEHDADLSSPATP
jgi:transcriptional regulator with XRE-family HTH domain